MCKEALGGEAKRKEFEELKREIDTLKPILDKIRMDDVVKSIREDRDNP